MTAQERLDYLLEVISIPRDEPRLTNSALGELTSPEVAEQVFDLIKATTESYAIQYVVNGIDTSTSAWKARVDAINAPTPELESLKPIIRDWEVIRRPRWETLPGYATEPTLESVQAELDAARLINAKALFCERMTQSGDAAAVWSQAWSDAAQ